MGLDLGLVVVCQVGMTNDDDDDGEGDDNNLQPELPAYLLACPAWQDDGEGDDNNLQPELPAYLLACPAWQSKGTLISSEGEAAGVVQGAK
ncbi:predicted protein [Plenodomus lingam JN3]|uniref:Predicted protein n=1 Tax=Leptosphaeria maculans (strain JN3 / isolate v23.1.3 / race Av1-4-5-6-7-8) TaxID=985895 RepID=E4ZRG9_LEPMJ|nr:predicted protein [Plenodomus lingam JN3]CBX93816.1 predicted protein [Plenodomus lingam JN3]